ncbi:PAS domain S-box protein [Arenibaculum pallidiluteum]|uniref:PAS domain S-box protein n=1 Tax=Arenibaculum pallidiluteum TaxID=2812559 RepID=UPI001A976E30|nr:PAS domain S-box protein [Arenibaculum pallidiluteum]
MTHASQGFFAPSADRSAWLPWAAALAGLIASALFWHALLDADRHTARVAAEARLDAATRAVQDSLRERTRALARMARRWEIEGNRDRAGFDLEAEVLREGFPSFRAVGWVDPGYHVRWIHPVQGNEAALGLSVNAEPVRAATYARARDTGMPAVTPPIDFVQGGRGVLDVVPINTPSGNAGFVYAAIDLQVLLERELSTFDPGYALSLTADGAHAFKIGDPRGEKVVLSRFEHAGVTWAVTVAPRLETAGRPVLPHVVFAVSAALSVMLGLAMRGRMLAAARARQAEEATKRFRESERRYRFLAETVPQIVWTATPEGGLDYVNPQWDRFTGKPQQAAHGASWAQHIHPDDLERTNQAWQNALQTGCEYQVEHRLRSVEGAYRWLRTRAAPLKDESGNVLMWIGTAADFDDERRALDALRTSEASLRAIVDTALDAIVVTDAEGTVRTFNRAAERLFGYGAEEVLGQNVRMLMPGEHARRHDVYMHRYRETGERRIIGIGRELDGCRKDGSTFPFEVTIAEWDAAGRPMFTAIMRDVTDRRRAEAEIRASEARFRELFETLPVGVVIIDPSDTSVEAFNPSACTMLGYDAEEFGRTRLADMAIGIGVEASPIGREDFITLVQSGIDPKALAQGEVRYRRKDGSEVDVLVTRRPIRTEAGMRVLAIWLDVTQRRQAERALAESGRLLQSVIDGAADPIFVKDTEGRFLLANRRTLRLLGSHHDAVIGRRDRDFLPAPLADAVEADDARVMAEGRAVEFEEVIPEQGESRTFLSAKSPLPDENGRVRGIIGVLRDITERKAAEEEVRRLNRDLERRVDERTRQLADANAELQGFAHSVAHDLRAPLRTLRGFSQALVEDYGELLDETARDYLGRIADGAVRMDHLIQDLLAYSRISREELVLEPLELDRVVVDVLRQLEGTLNGAEATVHVVRPLPWVKGHRAVLGQVLANLVSNAVKFVAADTKPEVRIRAERRSEGHVRLWVKDNGIGIALEHQTRIFQVFQRLHGMMQYPGTGIGLAIVRRGAERMGGSAGVESEPGAGSRFWVDLQEAESTDEK